MHNQTKPDEQGNAIRLAALVTGPCIAGLLGWYLHANEYGASVAWTAAITLLTAVWWIFEPIPIPATSLIPLAMFPLVGVLKPVEVGAAYGDKLILLLLGGLMLSSAMERSGAHRRIALGMVNLFGGASGRRLVFGFMSASALLSMWISNMATTLMLLPIVMAVVEKLTDQRLRVALLLGVAYAASVGGTGTPVGTPPNLIFIDSYQKATGLEVTFTTWMTWALPIVLIMIPLTGLWLTRGLSRQSKIELPEVGKWRSEEIRTLVVFAITAALWITRKEPYGGWSEALGIPAANDASVALLAVVAMFVIPNGKGEKLLVWETAVKIPWGILVLFSSGIAISKAFEASGLSVILGQQLEALCSLPPLVMVTLVCLSVTFLTEVTSNTATSNLLMPILAATATEADVDHKLLMVPAAISSSFAFMLPVATGPNAIIFSSNLISVRQMAREGFALNLIGTAVIVICSLAMFG
ncbi:SLC13 family permease [Adhaeretor mobilis]|uniref:Sodium-dependent dicarboxylate transporter SdcS n=1 Tax=Adhaeretor mobilis TaxID=1930276 RepID=A0A517MY04_9BACT|nr:SLC13 family permease [Adhaeretor mobilis]QDS99755.1 Sodium-dependent dicarboxylate transporter SdcS [Adhaeretor mobilis]